MPDTFARVAVVNRGEPAVRFIRAVRDFNALHGCEIETVALYASADRRARFVRDADDAVDLHALDADALPGGRRPPYLDHGLLERAIVAARADAVWVGWGFVSEQPAFADLCARLGVRFIGPPAPAMRMLGDKVAVKRLGAELGIPVTPWGGGIAGTAEAARAHADRLGYPVIVKPAVGAGGRGIRVAGSADEVARAWTAARDEARRLFGDDRLFVERHLAGARHIEVQVACDRAGAAWALDVRECSVQRRHQKILHESPAAGVGAEVERAIRSAAMRLAIAAGYHNLATVEFLLDAPGRHATLMEVNTRLQVEHAVTELTTGMDLVQLQILLARGGRLTGKPPEARGHAIEVRLNAEDPDRGFAAAPGTLRTLRAPTRAGLRLDSGVAEGEDISPEYDSMFARLSAHGPSRAEALRLLGQGLAQTTAIVTGGLTNRTFLVNLLQRDELRKGRVSVSWLDSLVARGAHVNRNFAEVALLVAAAEVYEDNFVTERDEFLATAARLRPVISPEIGRAVELRHGGHRYPFRVYRIGAEHYCVDTGGVRVDLRVDPISPYERLVSYDGTRHRAIVTSQGLTHLVEIDGALHRISRDDAGLVRAFSPAVVVDVAVRAGQRVKAGDRLVLLEAMKMETPVLSPADGTVRETLVLPNTQVGAGTPLARLDIDEERAWQDGPSRVEFAGVPVTSAAGRPASRARALVAGLKAFREALGPPDAEVARAVLDDLRDLMLGSDIDAVEARRLVDEYRHVTDALAPGDEVLLEREDRILRIFADVASLFRQRPDPDEPNEASALSAGQYFLTYLRTLEARGAGLPSTFVAELQRALEHYGSDSLEVTPALRSRLLWMWRANLRVDQQVAAITAILERRLRHVPELGGRAGQPFLELLDRLATASAGRFATVSDLARDVRYRYFEQPLFDRDRQAIHAEVTTHVEALASEPEAGDAEERMQALVDCPLPLGRLFVGDLADADPSRRRVMLEALARRYYRICSLSNVTATNAGARALVSADYETDGQRVRLLATHAPWAGIAEALASVRDLAASVGPGHDVVVDLYLEPATTPPDDMAACLGGLLADAGFTRAIRRVGIVSPGTGSDIAATAFTFRGGPDGFVEERRLRGLHPMIAKRMDLWRLDPFGIERLPSAEEVYLLRAVARNNPKDERLVALAEVRDTTPQRDATGTLVQVPHVERTLLECLAAVREAQARRAPEDRLQWNRVVLDIRAPITLAFDEMVAMLRRVGADAGGLGLEKIVLRGHMPVPDAPAPRDAVLNLLNPGGHGQVLSFEDPHDRVLQPLEEYTQKVVRMRQRGLPYPYEIVRMLTPGRESTASDLPPGEFVEHDLDDRQRLVPVDRPWGRNTANVVVGVVRNFTAKHPEGLTRVVLLGDASREMGSLAEPECRRILGALDLAESLGVPLEWFALSAGAKISMQSGTENMDWIGHVLRRIIEFTQAGREINVIVTGINVGAQPYWNAEATMLMHTRGILVMMPGSAMVLTGKTALDYSGSVSAEDNLGIGGYERIMGPNGQAQYWAQDLGEACQILMRHYDHAYVAPGERFPRRAQTTDPVTRDVCAFPHGTSEGADFALVGDVFSDRTNAGRKKPFDIRRVMLAVADQDHPPLERWAGMRDAEVGVVWDAHVGGYPVCMLGFESRSVARLGFVATDGPDRWTSGTLFPMSSKKIARAINAATANRPLLVLANLSGFDGSPESMRRRQLEFGAEIGRAITNFKGPIVFVVISRYHGGAFVVFSKTLNDNMQVAALEGTYASVIGGAPAAAVVFAREVDGRTKMDPRVKALEQQVAGAPEESRRPLRARLAQLAESVRSEKLGEVADEFDRIHSVHRALEVGSLDRIIAPADLRPYIVEALESGMAKELGQRSQVVSG